MDHPDPCVTWTAEPADLSAARSKKLRSAVTTVEHCLRLWQPFIAAATTHPLHVTVTTTDDLPGETTPTVGARLDIDQWHLHLQVPFSLFQQTSSQLAAQILDTLVPALVLLAEHHPHPHPPAFWEPPQAWQPPPPPENPELGIHLEHLLDDDPLIVGRHDGTPAGAEAREETLADYLCERLEEPAIAVYDSIIITDSAIGWNLELLPKD
jgi:hypothetical protein